MSIQQRRPVVIDVPIQQRPPAAIDVPHNGAAFAFRVDTLALIYGVGHRF